MKDKPNPEKENREQFYNLREEAEEKAKKQGGNRRNKDNPEPTETEIRMGAFKEDLDPQVREAVLRLNEKGYQTADSGFHPEKLKHQFIGGYFELSEQTKKELEKVEGVSVKEGENIEGYEDNYTRIEYKFDNPNSKYISKKLTEIVEKLPDKEQTAPPNPSGAAEDFREEYAPERKDIQKESLKRALELSEFEPEIKKEMEEKIEEFENESNS